MGLSVELINGCDQSFLWCCGNSGHSRATRGDLGTYTCSIVLRRMMQIDLDVWYCMHASEVCVWE